MSLSSAMSAGVSGLSINAEAISVVGNNIANVNTTGFKEGRTIFSDMLSANIGVGQVGRGGQIQAVQNNFTQGSFENTAGSNDLAIQGDSFFIVQNSAGTEYYTRAGAFDFNNSNVLTNPDGYEVVGYGINSATGLSNGIPGTIDKTAFASLPSKTTASAGFVLNLNSTDSMPGSKPTGSVSLNGNFGAATAPANTTFNIFDEFGNAHAATITWGGASPNYTYSITVAGTQTGTVGSATAPITGTLAFPSVTNPPVQTLQFTNGAKPVPVTIDFSNMQNAGATVAPTATQNGTAGQPTGTVSIAGGTTIPSVTSVKTTATVTNSTAAIPTVTAAVPNPAALTPTGDTTNTSTTVTNITTTGLVVGMDITGAGIPASTTIATIGPGNQITLSNAATATAAGVVLTATPNVTTNLSTTVTGVDTTNIVVGMGITGAGIPANTVVTAKTANSITLSQAATATAIGVALTTTSGVTNGSATVAGIDTTNIVVGMGITGAGIPANTVVTAKTANSITLSQNATADGSGVALSTQSGVTTGSPTVIGIDTTNIAVGTGITGAGIPANTVVTAKTANSITLSNNATANGSDVTLTTTSGVTIGSAAVAGIDTSNIVLGMVVTGAGIPANTVVTAKTANSITLSNAATATSSDFASLTASGSGFSFVDTVGNQLYGSLDITGGNWTATIAGASSPVTGTITTGTGGSTWSQGSKNVTINGVSQNVNFDFSQTTSASTAPTITANAFDINNPSLTSNFSNSIQVYDSQGNAHTATVYYRKTGGNTWDFHLSVPDATSINGMPGNNLLNGTMTFNSAGVLVSQTPSNTAGINVQFPGGVASQAITLDFNPNTSTQQASQSVVSSQTQDGYGAGILTSTSIDDKGYVNATYSNNQTQRIAQITTAKFAAVGGLEKAGNSLYNATAKSGTALLGTVDSQGGKIFTKSLEQSNVDMATQLVNMIRLQRAYTGNSKTITTSDQMMQETLTLIR